MKDEEKLRATAMEAVSEGIVVTADGHITYANPAFAQMYGYARPDELIGKRGHIFFDQPDEKLIAEIRRLAAAGGSWAGEFIGRRKNGSTFPVEASMASLPDGRNIYINRDISARKAAEQERDRLQLQFFQAQKMEAIGALAGGIAHDFNNLLAAIQGYATFLKEDLPESSKERRFANQILTASQRARDLVQQILAFSHHQSGEKEAIDLGLIIEETISLLQATVPKNIILASQEDVRHPLIWANGSQISQVLMNLCVNARDAMPPEGGQIKIALENVKVPGPETQKLLAQPRDLKGVGLLQLEDDDTGAVHLWMGFLPGPDTYLCLSVQDSGSGMDRKTIKRIFEPFFTTKDIGKGTGLGLAAVQGIVAGHGGAMSVRSKTGEGSRFEIYWPRFEVPAAKAAPQPQAAAEQGCGRVLLVDDEPLVRNMLSVALRRKGYQVQVCSRALEALACFNANPQGWDIVVTDQMMPDMNGDELAREISARRPGLPIILCSADIEALTAGQQAAAGITLRISKPVDPARFIKTVQEMLSTADALVE